MRKRITKNLLTAVALCTALSAEAYDFEAGGIYYNITSDTYKTVEVTFGSSVYAGDITIPSSVSNSGTTYTVTSIGERAFSYCSGLKSIDIPDGVTSVSEGAFSSCTGLTSIDIPDRVTEIGNYAFVGCKSLTSINIPDGVTSMGDGVFSGCTGLTSATLGKGVTSIGYSAFSDCSKLITITIPDGVTSIGNSAFYDCSSLTEINCLATVPPACEADCFSGVDKDKCTLRVPEGTEETYKTAKTWKEFLYEGIFSVEGINYAITSSLNKTVDVISGGNYTGNITIPATVINDGTTYAVTSIGNSAFSLCSELTSISLPNGVTSIGDSAFENCYDLTSIDIPDGVTSIGSSAFENCYDLTSIDIPDGVTSIAGRAFYRCSKLTSIDIPDGVTEIGTWAFRECSSLTSINIPDGVTEIGEWAFSSCSLISINIPERVTSIRQGVFHWCGSLTSIDIPDGVTSIGANAFEGCINLAEIYCAANVPPVCGNYCFDNVNKTACTLYVPEGTADDYRVADEWKDFTNILETDLSGIEEIAADAAADVKVYAAAGRIVVENAAAGTPIAVYSADGVQIYGGTVSDTRTEIPAPAGKLYIVKCGNAVFKTVM